MLGCIYINRVVCKQCLINRRVREWVRSVSMDKELEVTEATEDEEVEKVELTEEELAKKIESESDKKLEKALKTARDKWESETNERIERELKEAESLAKLTEKERQEAEFAKREETLNARLKELEQREAVSEASKALVDKGLPTELAQYVIADEAEETLSNINALKETFDNAVSNKVKESLKQDAPKSGAEITSDPFTEALKKLN